MIAKPVVKNKFWIVEHQGEKVATIQRCDQGLTWVCDNQRQRFDSFDNLKNHYNLNVDKWRNSTSKTNSNSVYKYPCDSVPYNSVWDLRHRVPLYTKTKKSRCYYAAGYYVMDGQIVFCPKYIFINRVEFKGPFFTEQEAEQQNHGQTTTYNTQSE